VRRHEKEVGTVGDVELDRHGAILVVRFAREASHNAISGSLLAELADAFDLAARDESVHVVVTTGNGKAFSVGADLPEMLSHLDLPVHRILNGPEVGGDRGYGVLTDGQARIEDLGVGRFAQRLLALEKPTIAALNGSAAGGGLAIALLHDYRIAAERARLSASWSKVGVAPEMGASYILPRLMGYRAAFDFVLRSRVLSAAEALDIGLVDRVVPTENVLDAALELAEELAALPTLAAQMTKRIMRGSGTASLEQTLKEEYRALSILFASPHVKETMATLYETVRMASQRGAPPPSSDPSGTAGQQA
jgi:enoyl-CoA hydratase/carnithine racemase